MAAARCTVASLLVAAAAAGACSAPPDPDATTDAGSGPADAGVTTMRVRLLVTLGSSSTAGSGASSDATRYVNRVATALGARLVNLGTGGQTVTQVQQTYLPMALDALDAGPRAADELDVVTFLPFTDFASSSGPAIAQGYAPVLTALEPSGARVMFGIPTINPRYTCGSAGDLRGPDGECYPATLVQEYADKGAAVRTELVMHALVRAVDIPQTQAEQPAWIAPDGHPNDPGHAFLADCFIHAIRMELGQDAGPAPVP